jgi:hypothetical protein
LFPGGLFLFDGLPILGNDGDAFRAAMKIDVQDAFLRASDGEGGLKGRISA